MAGSAIESMSKVGCMGNESGGVKGACRQVRSVSPTDDFWRDSGRERDFGKIVSHELTRPEKNRVGS